MGSHTIPEDFGIAISGSEPGAFYINMKKGAKVVNVYKNRSTKDKPSVFLSFIGQADRYATCCFKKQMSYKLRLTNNSPNPINVEARISSTIPLTNLTLHDGTKVKSLPDGTEVELCYEVESVIELSSTYKNGKLNMEIPTQTKLPEIPIYCTCQWSQDKERRNYSSGLWIPSDSSVDFYVPQQYLRESLKIYSIFNYEWEFTNGDLNMNEPHHQVFFYSADLPAN